MQPYCGRGGRRHCVTGHVAPNGIGGDKVTWIFYSASDSKIGAWIEDRLNECTMVSGQQQFLPVKRA